MSGAADSDPPAEAASTASTIASADDAEPPVPEWVRKVESFPQVDPVVLLGIAPVGLYLLLDWAWDVRAAIGAATAAAVVVFFVQRRLRPEHKVVFRLAMLGLAIIIGAGIAGLIRGDGKVFWASDPIEDFVVGGIFAVSLLMRRPIVGPVIRELFPAVASRLPGDHRVWMTVTAAWTVKILLAGVLRLWLLDSVEASTYAILRWPLGWAMNAVLFAWSFHLISTAIREYQAERLQAARDGGAGPDDSDDGSGEMVWQSQLRKG